MARKFITDFRDFILRGNIVDLAVGVVIGVAFNGLVTRFTDDFIQPLIKLAGGGGVFSGSFKIASQRFLWADFINSIISFVITAAVVFFFVVKPMNMLLKRAHRNDVPPPEAPPTDETRVLREIRDILLADRDTRAATVAAAVGSAAPGGSGSDGSTAPGQRAATDRPATDEG